MESTGILLLSGSQSIRNCGIFGNQQFHLSEKENSGQSGGGRLSGFGKDFQGNLLQDEPGYGGGEIIKNRNCDFSVKFFLPLAIREMRVIIQIEQDDIVI